MVLLVFLRVGHYMVFLILPLAIALLMTLQEAVLLSLISNEDRPSRRHLKSLGFLHHPNIEACGIYTAIEDCPTHLYYLLI